MTLAGSGAGIACVLVFLGATACEGELELAAGDFSLHAMACGIACPLRQVAWEPDGAFAGEALLPCAGQATDDELQALAAAASHARALERVDHLDLVCPDGLTAMFEIDVVAGAHAGERGKFVYGRGCSTDVWDPMIRDLLDAAFAPVERLCE